MSENNASSITLSKSIAKNFLFSPIIIEDANKVVGITLKKAGSNDVSYEDGLYSLNINWSYSLPKDFAIVKVKENNVSNLSKRYYITGGEVTYKYLNRGIIAVLSKSVVEGSSSLLVSLLLNSNGKLIYQTTISGISFTSPPLIELEDNYIVLAYTRKTKFSSHSEILVIEGLKQKKESLIGDVFSKIMSGEQEPADVVENDTIFLTQNYIIDQSIVKLFFSKTIHEMSNKQIILVSSNNIIYSISKGLISTRRPLVKDFQPGTTPTIDWTMNHPYIDPEIFPYQPTLLLDPKTTINQGEFV